MLNQPLYTYEGLLTLQAPWRCWKCSGEALGGSPNPPDTWWWSNHREGNSTCQHGWHGFSCISHVPSASRTALWTPDYTVSDSHHILNTPSVQNVHVVQTLIDTAHVSSDTGSQQRFLLHLLGRGIHMLVLELSPAIKDFTHSKVSETPRAMHSMAW